ncbi:ParB/RepB/Spo0J family partition protein [Nocardioides marmoribigeumensis]|uniref:ParB family chromosome partitioning protein n=1 Tax=Nocardioides marmoribigeumensis TaxID=433649 RepID=A0ABU2BUM4_9ACTN|nr:ParB/RepB/Spo0J family partition protein [Nocardioides marmoribigeumensis]MDR7362330.1 ParB family chromosome partitioning protein [Nocardioides marmoribigeumensis]
MTDTTPPRRGLGRGLGSLIPTAPPSPATPPAEGGTGTAVVDRVTASPDWIGRMPGGAPPAQGTPRHGADEQAGSADDEGATTRAQEAQEAQESQESQGDPPLVAGAYFAELPVTAIIPNARQPRQVFEEEGLAELVHSIREVGLLQPIVVRRLTEGEVAGEEARYELVMGERRWRATQEAGLDTIPAIVRETGDDAMLRDALLENLHRVQLNPLEEAAAYQQLLEDFGCTHEDLASRIGRSRPQISNTLRLLKLSPSVQRRVAAGVLSAGHARALLGVLDGEAQDRLAGRVVAEGISVRALEEIVALGDHQDDKPATTRRKSPTSPALLDLADRLSDLFDTRVKVDLGRSKGKITIEYASLEDLDRIIGTIDPSYERRHDDESTSPQDD